MKISLKKLKTFLIERKVRIDDDYPDVTTDELCDLYDIMSNIIDAKFERDCDNDSVINFQIYNRQSTFPLPYMQVKQIDENLTVEDALESINNAHSVIEQYNNYTKAISHRMLYNLERKKNK